MFKFLRLTNLCIAASIIPIICTSCADISMYDEFEKSISLPNVTSYDNSTESDKLEPAKPLTYITADEAAYELETEFGISIVRISDESFFDFTAEPVTSDDALNAGLTELRKSMTKYPDNFFRAFCYGNIKGINIYICDQIKKNDDALFPSAATFCSDNMQNIVLDISQPENIEGNFAHEIMHAVDSKIDYKIKNENFTAFNHDVWNELNPPGFSYIYGYEDDEGNGYSALNLFQFTSLDPKTESNINNIYFADYYSCTYPTEDRARIFEYLMTSQDELPWIFDSTNLKRKTEYMCFALRQAFLEIMPETAYWEKFIDIDSEYDI